MSNKNQNVPTAVGTNRTWKQMVSENLKNGWEKIKSNDFVNMIYPIDEVSKGNTMAGVVAAIPGEAALAKTALMGIRALLEPPGLPVGKIIKIVEGIPSINPKTKTLLFEVILEDGTKTFVTRSTLFRQHMKPKIETLVDKFNLEFPYVSGYETVPFKFGGQINYLQIFK